MCIYIYIYIERERYVRLVGAAGLRERLLDDAGPELLPHRDAVYLLNLFYCLRFMLIHLLWLCMFVMVV